MELPDPNRPMKIAEKFTELFDNDWTDSMEALEENSLTLILLQCQSFPYFIFNIIVSHRQPPY
jgi:hypothetical protein